MPTAAHLLRLARDAAPTHSPPPADTQLLQRYVSMRDEAAFAELVRRDGPLVLRACRHILGESGADDAFQATFLLLVRSARRLTRPGSLAGWLHAAAVRIATNARRGEERRRKRERSRPIPSASPDDLTWREVREVLDREIAALPERYRLPFLLCHVLELPHEEAARRAGCPVGALRGRLERGKDQLRKRLARYGLPLAAPVLVLGAPPPVAAALVEATLRVVCPGMNDAVPSALAGLLRTTSGLRTSLFLAPAAAAVIVIGAVLATSGGPGGEPPSTEPPRATWTAATEPQVSVDALGDPLPPGALARLGSARFHHGRNLSRVIVGADGKLVASEAGFGSYKLWEGDTGRPVPLWDGLTRQGAQPVRFNLVTAEGRLALVDWNTSGSRILDPATGELIRNLPAIDALTDAHVAPDGKTVAVLRREMLPGMNRSTLRVWNADSEKWTDLDDNPGQPAYPPHHAFHFSADSKRLAFKTNDTAVTVWDLTSAKPLLNLPPTGQGFLEATALSTDGKHLAREDRATTRIQIWDVDTGKELPPLPDQPKELGQSLAFSPDGKTLAAVVRPITIRLWDVTARKKLRDIQGHGFQILGLAFSGDGKRLYAADGNSVSVWDPVTGKSLDDYGGHRYAIWDTAWSPDGKRLASAPSYTDKISRIWDPATGRKVFDLVGGTEAVTYKPDGSLLATRGQGGTVQLWDPSTGKELHSLAAINEKVYRMAFSPDGRFIVSGGMKALHVWDVAARTEARTILHGGEVPLQVTFIPNRGCLLVRDWKAGTRVIDFTTGCEVARLDEAGKTSTAAAVSPDGRHVALADPGGAVRLADALTGREVRILVSPFPTEPSPPIRRLPTAMAEAMGLDYSPDGRLLAAAYRNEGIRVYEVATGTERFRFTGHVDEALGVSFSPDGNRLCSSSGDRTILVWDVTGGRLPSASPPKDLAAAWVDLASPDAAKGFAAIRYMVEHSAPALRLLLDRVKPTRAADTKAIDALVGKLGSTEFAEREAASKELAALAPDGLDPIRAAMQKSESPEVRNRLAAILAQSAGSRLTGEPLRSARVVEVLERIATVPARKLLTELASGASDATTTREAKQALDRLNRR